MIKFRKTILYEISNILNQIVFKLNILLKALESYIRPMLIFEINKVGFLDTFKYP